MFSIKHKNCVAYPNEFMENNLQKLTSPELSSSSSELPAQSVWALKAPSMLARNSCTAALSFSGSGALFEKDVMKLPYQNNQS